MRGSFEKLFLLLMTVFAFSGQGSIGVIERWVNVPEKFRPELGRSEATAPLVVGDIVYIGNLNGEISATHRTEGYVIWKTKLEAGVEGALTYGRANLFVGDVFGNFYALNSRDGSVAWKIQHKAEWLSPPLVYRNKVIVANSASEIMALSVRKGEELWQYSRSGDEKMTIRGIATPVVFGAEVYQGFADGSFVALSEAEGRLVWSRNLRSKDQFYDVDSTPSVDETHILIGIFDGRVYCLDRLKGDTRWIFPVGNHRGFLVEENRVYFSGLDHKLYCLDKATGTVLWETPFESSAVGTTPVRVGEYLLVTTSEDPSYIVDPKDGKIVQRISLGAGTFARATSHPDGWFFIHSNFGFLRAFELVPYSTAVAGSKIHQGPSALGREIVGHSKITS